MSFWNAEQITENFSNFMLEVTSAGVLTTPIYKYKISRNSKHQLSLITFSKEHTDDKADIYPEGIHTNENEVLFDGLSGSSAKIFGVQPISTTTKNNYVEDTVISTQTSTITNIEFYSGRQGETAYTFEWILNFPSNDFLWPTKFASTETISLSKAIEDGSNISFSTSITKGRFSNSGIKLTVGGFEICLSASPHDEKSNGPCPGSLLIIGAPNDDTRHKIIDSLSFALGLPLISLGHSEYDSSQKLIKFKAVNAHTMGGRSLELFCLPPAPITLHRTNLLDIKLVSEVSNSIYSNYERYSFRTLLWRYWHAVVAPMHMAPAYYGAMLESLQKNYLKDKNCKINSRIIDRHQYNKIKLIILDATKELDLDEIQKSTLINKLNDGNKASQKVITERFFADLNLFMSEIETVAWSRRNDAAHGNELPNGDYISLIRETNLLKTMLHRTIIKLTGGSMHYIDYHSPYRPIKDLSQGADPENR